MINSNIDIGWERKDIGHQYLVMSSNESALQTGVMFKLTITNISRIAGINNFHLRMNWNGSLHLVHVLFNSARVLKINLGIGYFIHW